MKLIFSPAFTAIIIADLAVFDLSSNALIGQIPAELDSLQTASIHLGGNSDM